MGSLVAEGDSLHLAWSEVWGWEYTPFLWYKRSLDRGDTWRDERQMHHRRGAFAALAALGNEVHFVWSGVKTRLYYKRSLEAGWSWQAREHLVRGKPYSSANWDEQPAIAVSADGVAHVVYSVDLGMLYYKRSR